MMINQAREFESVSTSITYGDIKYPWPVSIFAKIVSYVFHPVFIPAYITYFLVFLHPTYFVGLGKAEKFGFFRSVIANMVFFPLIAVVLLKAVGFIDSVFLRTQRDRIIPYIVSGIFFFWMYLVFRNQEQVSAILTTFIFGVFLTSSLALIANIYFKISMHALGVGGALGLLLLILYTNPGGLIAVPLMITLLITGLVCTCRMIASNHTPPEIYLGLFAGIICQFIAAFFIL